MEREYRAYKADHLHTNTVAGSYRNKLSQRQLSAPFGRQRSINMTSFHPQDHAHLSSMSDTASQAFGR